MRQARCRMIAMIYILTCTMMREMNNEVNQTEPRILMDAIRLLRRDIEASRMMLIVRMNEFVGHITSNIYGTNYTEVLS